MGSTHADEKVTIDGDAIEKVAKFLYLENVPSSGGGEQEAVIARIRWGWKKLRI